MESKYKPNQFSEGSTVHAKLQPGVPLIIRRYLEDIYYCKLKDEPEKKELVYFERELEAD